MAKVTKKGGSCRRRGGGSLTIAGAFKGVMTFVRQNWLIGLIAISTAAIAAVLAPKKNGKTNWTAVAIAGLVPVVARMVFKRMLSPKDAIAASTLAMALLYLWESGLRDALMGTPGLKQVVDGSEKLAYSVKGAIPMGGGTSAPSSGMEYSYAAPAPSAPAPSTADQVSQYVQVGTEALGTLGDFLDQIGITGVGAYGGPRGRMNPRGMGSEAQGRYLAVSGGVQ